jgi:putative membrane protein
MPDADPPRPPTNEEYRMVLQLETSLLVWLRTSLALMGFGFVVARFGLFLREVAAAVQVGVNAHPWLGTANTATGIGLIVLGVAVMALAVRNHQQSMDQLMRGELRFPARWSLGVVLALAVCALGVGIAVYLSFV